MDSQTHTRRQKLTLREEFRLGLRTTPRVWLMVLAVALMFLSPLSGIVGGLLIWAGFAVVVLFALLVLPAVIGATTGWASGTLLRKIRQQIVRFSR